jgi:hypothetical protein
LGEYVKAGGLILSGANISDRFQHAATFVDKILRGAKTCTRGDDDSDRHL